MSTTEPRISDRDMVAIAYKHNVRDMADAIVNLRRDLRRTRQQLELAQNENAQMQADRDTVDRLVRLALERRP